MRDARPGRRPSTRYRLAADAFCTVAAYYAEIAAYLNQIGGNTYPEAPRDGAREGRRPAATARTRTSGRRSTARPPTAPARSPTPRSSTARRRRSTTCSTSTPPTGSPRDYTAPTVVITKHTDPVGLASAEELVEAYRRALETDPVASFGGIVGVNRELDGATAREIAGELVRGGDRARLLAGGARHPRGEARPRAARRPARRRPRACATTASRTSTSSASAAACSSRRSTPSTSTAASSRSSPAATRRWAS